MYKAPSYKDFMFISISLISNVYISQPYIKYQYKLLTVVTTDAIATYVSTREGPVREKRKSDGRKRKDQHTYCLANFWHVCCIKATVQDCAAK